MRNIEISQGEYYHIYNRGVLKQAIFHNIRDWSRFLFLITYLQSPIAFANPNRIITNFVEHRVFNINSKIEATVIKERYVELVCFCLMPNHFHLIVKEIKPNGISRYMQRVLNGYSKYFNTKYKKSGHVFQGPYKAKHVSDNNSLLYLSTYIHKNPTSLRIGKDGLHKYQWSSYFDYIVKNRWNNLLASGVIDEQFSSPDEYKEFVGNSTAKETVDKIADLLF